MKTYLQFINETHIGNQKKPADSQRSNFAVFSNKKDLSNMWTTGTDFLDMYGCKYFYKKEPAIMFIKQLIKEGDTKEVFLIKKNNNAPTNHFRYTDFYPYNDEKYLELWWGNAYWNARAKEEPQLFNKYIFGLEKASIDLMSEFTFKELDFIKRYLIKLFPNMWEKIIKSNPELNTGSELGEIGF